MKESLKNKQVVFLPPRIFRRHFIVFDFTGLQELQVFVMMNPGKFSRHDIMYRLAYNMFLPKSKGFFECPVASQVV